MRKFFYPAIISIFLTSCSTAPFVENNINSNVSNVSTAGQKEVNEPSNKVEVQTETSRVKAQPLPSVVGEASNAETKKAVNANLAPIQAKPLVNPAPDDSEISSAMNKKGVPIETRTFKNNPLLAKVEKIFTDEKNPQIVIYLKSGKIVNLPAGKISDTATAPASEILLAAGIAPKPAATNKETKTELQKREQ